ncbi:hypothetical protein D3C87_1777950 [compost metagenome]
MQGFADNLLHLLPVFLTLHGFKNDLLVIRVVQGLEQILLVFGILQQILFNLLDVFLRRLGKLSRKFRVGHGGLQHLEAMIFRRQQFLDGKLYLLAFASGKKLDGFILIFGRSGHNCLLRVFRLQDIQYHGLHILIGLRL